MAAEDDRDRKIAELKRRLVERDRLIEQLRKKIERLERINEELRRAAKRQATPFSRGEPKANPAKRGRKRGRRYGRRASRSMPSRIDRVVHVPAPMWCPACEKPAKLIGRRKQWQSDIPPAQATTTEFRIDVARCTNCGRELTSRSPEQTSDAVGAAGVQIGARAVALAAKLNKECGISYGRIADLFDKAFGLTVSRSAISRAVDRLARRLAPVYDQIAQQVRSRPMLSPDETGWKIGGHKAWLHTAATRDETVYKIARGRGRAEAESLIGDDYGGTIVRDGWIAYRGRGAFAKAASQTCLAHLLRRIGHLIDLDPPQAVVEWLVSLKKVLQRAIGVCNRRDAAQIGPHGLMVAIGQIESQTDRLLHRCPNHAGCRRLTAHLRNERAALFTFLYRDAVPATNFLAEQALRPAVVNRKMSGGNNTPRGARTQEILMTVFHTARKRGLDALACSTEALRNPASVSRMLSER